MYNLKQFKYNAVRLLGQHLLCLRNPVLYLHLSLCLYGDDMANNDIADLVKMHKTHKYLFQLHTISDKIGKYHDISDNTKQKIPIYSSMNDT